MEEIPFDTVGVYTINQKLKLGLQELKSGTRNVSIDKIALKDLMALIPEAAKVSNISQMMGAYPKNTTRFQTSETSKVDVGSVVQLSL